MRGTTYVCFLDPSIRESAPDPAGPVALTRLGMPFRPRTSLVVLVDDDRACGDVIGEILVGDFGCRVLVCTSAGQAEPIIASTQPDLVLLDLLLPDSNGLVTLRALKANPTTLKIPIIVCTAATLAGAVRSELLEAGAAAILPKPFDLDELLQLVRLHCRPPMATPAGGVDLAVTAGGPV